MSEIRINSIKIKNYRSFGEEQEFRFPEENYNKPVAIVGYNNCGKTNLMNCILYGIGEKFVNRETFTLNDFHYRKIQNTPSIDISLSSSIEKKYDGKKANLNGNHKLDIQIDGDVIEGARIYSFYNNQRNYDAFGATRYYNIFYVNFHCIKEEISTQKTSWGNLKSFLAKHIRKLVDEDSILAEKKEYFKKELENATADVLEGSKLKGFIDRIKSNYSHNLRGDNCEVMFSLPHYEDIFLQMMFKVGLNCKDEFSELVPLNHFGDGYISMFVMAVIQSIAETNTNDKCLFLFEEPESFLHENHQEYFYKSVLCNLAERGHQVVYTTHSDRMVDIFSPEGIIRLEFDETRKQTEKRYNEIERFSSQVIVKTDETIDILGIGDFNNYIKSIEPNLNKILFSRKVILVEGPNDLMAYRFAIEHKINQIRNNVKFAQTYLSFQNFAIIPHHGKSTALVLIKLLNRIKLDFFLITDWDFEEDFIEELSAFDDPAVLRESQLYKNKYGELPSATSKAMITTNWKLLKNAKTGKIHFNVKKLEHVIGYGKHDKSSLGFWERLNQIDEFTTSFFPPHLEAFLEFDKLKSKEEADEKAFAYDELPF